MFVKRQTTTNVLLVVNLCFMLCVLATERTLMQNNDEELYSRDFYSVPTTVKTYENDTVLLPCGYKCKFFLCPFDFCVRTRFQCYP